MDGLRMLFGDVKKNVSGLLDKNFPDRARPDGPQFQEARLEAHPRRKRNEPFKHTRGMNNGALIRLREVSPCFSDLKGLLDKVVTLSLKDVQNEQEFRDKKLPITSKDKTILKKMKMAVIRPKSAVEDWKTTTEKFHTVYLRLCWVDDSSLHGYPDLTNVQRFAVHRSKNLQDVIVKFAKDELENKIGEQKIRVWYQVKTKYTYEKKDAQQGTRLGYRWKLVTSIGLRKSIESWDFPHCDLLMLEKKTGKEKWPRKSPFVSEELPALEYAPVVEVTADDAPAEDDVPPAEFEEKSVQAALEAVAVSFQVPCSTHEVRKLKMGFSELFDLGGLVEKHFKQLEDHVMSELGFDACDGLRRLHDVLQELKQLHSYLEARGGRLNSKLRRVDLAKNDIEKRISNLESLKEQGNIRNYTKTKAELHKFQFEVVDGIQSVRNWILGKCLIPFEVAGLEKMSNETDSTPSQDAADILSSSRDKLRCIQLIKHLKEKNIENTERIEKTQERYESLKEQNHQILTLAELQTEEVRIREIYEEMANLRAREWSLRSCIHQSSFDIATVEDRLEELCDTLKFYDTKLCFASVIETIVQLAHKKSTEITQNFHAMVEKSLEEHERYYCDIFEALYISKFVERDKKNQQLANLNKNKTEIQIQMDQGELFDDADMVEEAETAISAANKKISDKSMIISALHKEMKDLTESNPDIEQLYLKFDRVPLEEMAQRSLLEFRSKLSLSYSRSLVFAKQDVHEKEKSLSLLADAGYEDAQAHYQNYLQMCGQDMNFKKLDAPK